MSWVYKERRKRRHFTSQPCAIFPWENMTHMQRTIEIETQHLGPFWISPGDAILVHFSGKQAFFGTKLLNLFFKNTTLAIFKKSLISGFPACLRTNFLFLAYTDHENQHEHGTVLETLNSVSLMPSKATVTLWIWISKCSITNIIMQWEPWTLQI